MVKRYFQNIDVECWQHLGRIGLSEPSVCLFQSSPQPCESILLAVDELESEGPSSRRTLAFTPCNRKWAFSALRLKHLPDSKSLRVMNISCEAAISTIEMTSVGLELFRKSLMTWRDGGEDFGMAPRHTKLGPRDLGDQDLASGEMWFWGPSYTGP